MNLKIKVMLTETEIKDIKKDSDSCYRRINSFAYPQYMNDIEREWIIKMIAEYITAERIKAKRLIEALKKIGDNCWHSEFPDKDTCPACIATQAIHEYNNKQP